MSSRLKYRIENLEWQQFELLAFKCLQYDISPSIQYLEGGNDKGRDFIFEGVTNFFDQCDASQSFVFQAKHKSNLADFSKLKQDLAAELRKVYIKHSQKYQIYCLVTNLALTGNEHDELEHEFSEFVKKNGLSLPRKFTIYSYRHFETCLDKNKLLRISFPSIIQIADYKSLIEEIVLKTEQNIISVWLKAFEKNAAKFVYTEIYENSLNALRANNAILLSGPPKSGKTFTAEMLAFNMFAAAEYIPYNITNIDAFFDFFDLHKKQLFLFDDSIGKHSIESYRADALNRSVNSILQSLDDNHKIIFTSREYIIKDYQAYTDSSSFLSSIIKINASASDWKPSEKESLLGRYFRLAFEKEMPYSIDSRILGHKNFEPESIRAYFENHPTDFSYANFIKHLDKPDQYLHRLFDNLNEDKKIVLLSILFSLNGTAEDIGFTFNNILDDLKIQRLINLKLQLEILQDSVTVNKNNIHSFLHPSMFDFFIQLISTDLATYRKLMFKNFNLNLLAVISLKSVNKNHKEIVLHESDLANMAIGLERILKNPSITLFEINSVFAWLATPDFQLRRNIEKIHGYAALKRPFIRGLQSLDYTPILKNSNIFHAIDFIKNVNLEGDKNTLNEIAIERILKRFEFDSNYWQLALRASSFLSETQITQLIGKNWLNNFYSSLKDSIDLLGKQLFGDAYPDFIEMKRHRETPASEVAFGAMEKRQTSFYMIRTNFDWYPNYIKVKQQVGVLKSCHPHGFKIYSRIIEKFELIKRLEDHEKNRYNYKLKHTTWDMINGHQPKFMDADQYADLEEDFEKRRDEEE